MSDHVDMIALARMGDNNAISDLVYRTNRDDATSRFLVDQGLLQVVLLLLQPYPSESPVWNDDRIDDHPVYWNAFDVLTNLCKWESVRLDLIKAGVVKFLDVLAKKDNYFGFEATEGMAYIIGREEDGAHSELLLAREANVEKIIKVLRNSLDSDAEYFGMRFSVYGRVLALQCLSLSDTNKPMLTEAVPLMFRILKESHTESLLLAWKCLLELSFDAQCFKKLKQIPNVVDEMQAISTNGDAQFSKLKESLMFRLQQSSSQANSVGGRGSTSRKSVKDPKKYVMISYSWASQSAVKLLVPLLEASGLNVWVDYNEMQGDTIEAMALAVEQCAAFIMVMSEAYKESGNCRLEASYAFGEKKPIIPLLAEIGYKPTGWLGILVNSKLYYPITLPEHIQENAPKIVKDLFTSMGDASQALAGAQKLATHAHLTGSGVKPTQASATVSFPFPGKKVTEMTPEQIEAFFKIECKLPKIAPAMKKAGVNGRTLAMIWDMHQRGGNAQRALEVLGIHRPVDAMEVLYQLRILVGE